MLKRAVQEAAEGERVVTGENNVLGIGVDIDSRVIEAIRDGWQADNAIEEDLATEETKSVYWAPLLQTVLWAYHCSRHTSTGYSPAMLALGKELRMPFDQTDEHPKTEAEHGVLIARRINWLTEGIPGLRELKTKEVGIGSFKQYELGQRMMDRTFFIHSVWDKNVYKLRTDPLITGKRVGYLKNPINGSRLKAYVEGEVVS
ncbi:hypothetical protein BGX38DRAFT_1271323 [Terfezia claveryi]|nr:hypothetical protein BGX38DRAFT_1271323 [Terfezia claveryi]